MRICTKITAQRLTNECDRRWHFSIFLRRRNSQNSFVVKFVIKLSLTTCYSPCRSPVSVLHNTPRASRPSRAPESGLRRCLRWFRAWRGWGRGPGARHPPAQSAESWWSPGQAQDHSWGGTWQGQGSWHHPEATWCQSAKYNCFISWHNRITASYYPSGREPQCHH